MPAQKQWSRVRPARAWSAGASQQLTPQQEVREAKMYPRGLLPVAPLLAVAWAAEVPPPVAA